MEELLKEYEDLIDIDVKTIVSNKSVKMSSVCPREDHDTLDPIGGLEE